MTEKNIRTIGGWIGEETDENKELLDHFAKAVEYNEALMKDNKRLYNKLGETRESTLYAEVKYNVMRELYTELTNKLVDTFNN